LSNKNGKLCNYRETNGEHWYCVRFHGHRGDHSPFVVDRENGESLVELGDGEPSPQPPNCPECKQGMVPVDSIVDGRNVTGYACHKCASVYSPESSHGDAKKLERIRQAAVKISWRDGAYRVNKPNFDGGWVVPLEIAIDAVRSGAAQEVSPPSPEPVCPMCCKPVFTDGYEGDTRELKAALAGLLACTEMRGDAAKLLAVGKAQKALKEAE
jgi:hypothetical protein